MTPAPLAGGISAGPGRMESGRDSKAAVTAFGLSGRRIRRTGAAAILLLAACSAPTDRADAEARYETARRDFDNGRWEAAAAEYERVVGKRPSFRDAWRDLGVCYERLGRDAEALRVYEQSLAQADSRDEVVLRRLLDVQKRKGLFDGAIATATRLCEVRPGDAGLQAELVELAKAKAGQDVHAEKERLKRAIVRCGEIEARAEEFIKAKRYDEALGIVESYPAEFRDTACWTGTLRALRERIWKLRDPQ